MMKKAPRKPIQKEAPQTIAAAAFNSSPERKWMALVVAVLALLLYANTLGHDFAVDDGTVIENNSITKKGISALPEIFTTSYRAGFWDRNEGMYRPLSVAMFAIEYELSPGNAFLGHLVNILLYALTAFLMFHTLARMFPRNGNLLPFLATILFVVHPLHTEVVANIKSRDEILCFLFALLSLDSMLRYGNNGKPLQLLLSVFFFFLSFLSKESAITMLAVLPLSLWFFTEGGSKKIIGAVGALAVATTIYFVIRLNVLGSLTGTAEQQVINNSLIGAETFADRFATAIFIIGKYLLLLLIPHPLVFDYSFNQIPNVSFTDIRALLGLAAVLFLVYTAVKGLREKSPVAYGILYFFITFSLVSNVVILIESTMAERFMYMPSFGMAIAAGMLISIWYKSGANKPVKDILTSKMVPTAVVGIIVLLFSVKTIARNSDWKDNLTLLEKDVKTSPNSARIRYAFGSALLIEKALKLEKGPEKTNYLTRSTVELERGVSILPSYAEAWYHLGLAYKELDNPEKAIPAFETARKYKTFKGADFYIASGLAYGQGKQYDKALADFTIAISKDTTNPEAYNNKGLYFTEKGVLDSAIFYLNHAISMKPEFYQAWYNRGNTWAKGGDFNKAIADYKKALEIKPGYTDAMLNLGNSYAAMADYKNALLWFEQLLAVDPGNPKLLYNIGITYNILGDTLKGNDYIRRAQGG